MIHKTTPTASLKYLREDVIGDLLPTSHSLDPLLNTVTANPPHGSYCFTICLCFMWVQKLCVCVCVCVKVCVHVCIYVCACACTCVCACVHIVHVCTCEHVCVHVHVYMFVHASTCTCARVCVHMRIYVCMCEHAHVCVCMCTDMIMIQQGTGWMTYECFVPQREFEIQQKMTF